MRIIVTGLIGQYSLGGVVWDYMQYLLGFRALGHDVWYLEDTGAWPYHREREEISADCSLNVAHLKEVMESFDLGDRWIYRNEPDGKYHGVPNGLDAESLLARADVLINVSGACWLRDCTSRIRKKIFVDGDPMFTQIQLLQDSTGERRSRLEAHSSHFTFGLSVGQPGCLVPQGGITWKPTVQPVAMDWWEKTEPSGGNAGRNHWTTVMNWVSYHPIEYAGHQYGQKDEEFLRFLDLPKQTGEPFLLAMGRGIGNRRPTDLLLEKGWHIEEPLDLLPDHLAYRDFLASSKGEWSVAKNGYVKALTGWFSCRTACYLAAGRPAVVQETGWSDHLPSGEGVIAFSDLESAARAIEEINRDPDRHSRAAQQTARKYFEASMVCQSLLDHSE